MEKMVLLYHQCLSALSGYGTEDPSGNPRRAKIRIPGTLNWNPKKADGMVQ
jgi:hypothetical protein